MSEPTDKRILRIAELRAAGKTEEANAEIAALQRDFPRATPDMTEQVLAMMMKHMRSSA